MYISIHLNHPDRLQKYKKKTNTTYALNLFFILLISTNFRRSSQELDTRSILLSLSSEGKKKLFLCIFKYSFFLCLVSGWNRKKSVYFFFFLIKRCKGNRFAKLLQYFLVIVFFYSFIAIIWKKDMPVFNTKMYFHSLCSYTLIFSFCT